ncbi:MAG: 4Fe-4S binding protein, partial [Eubacteriales bacterium]
KKEYDFSTVVIEENDLCFIGVPSFAGRVPINMMERLHKMQVNGGKAILVVSYGNREIDDTLLELKEEVKARGFTPVAAISAVAEHSMVRKYGANRPDEEDAVQLKDFSQQLKEKIEANDIPTELELPGKFPYKEFKGIPLKPKSNKDCVACGFCASVCPVGAIPKEEPSKTNEEVCMTCMRCVAVCPKQARSLNKAMVFALSQRLKGPCEVRKENELF